MAVYYAEFRMWDNGPLLSVGLPDGRVSRGSLGFGDGDNGKKK